MTGAGRQWFWPSALVYLGHFIPPCLEMTKDVRNMINRTPQSLRGTEVLHRGPVATPHIVVFWTQICMWPARIFASQTLVLFQPRWTELLIYGSIQLASFWLISQDGFLDPTCCHIDSFCGDEAISHVPLSDGMLTPRSHMVGRSGPGDPITCGRCHTCQKTTGNLMFIISIISHRRQ